MRARERKREWVRAGGRGGGGGGREGGREREREKQKGKEMASIGSQQHPETIGHTLKVRRITLSSGVLKKPSVMTGEGPSCLALSSRGSFCLRFSILVCRSGTDLVREKKKKKKKEILENVTSPDFSGINFQAVLIRLFQKTFVVRSADLFSAYFSIHDYSSLKKHLRSTFLCISCHGLGHALSKHSTYIRLI